MQGTNFRPSPPPEATPAPLFCGGFTRYPVQRNMERQPGGYTNHRAKLSLQPFFSLYCCQCLMQTLGHRGTCSHRKSEDDSQMTENILPRVDLFNHAYSMNLLKYFREFYISLLKYHFFQFVREVVNSIHGQGPS